MSNKIGEKWVTNEGCKIEIIEYLKWDSVSIKFDNGYVLSNLTYQNIKNGGVKNPFHKSIYNVGYLGVGNYFANINRKPTFIHTRWKNMLQRCYSDKYHLKFPTYKNCSVCDEWLNFQKFAEWFEQNYIEGFELDKDILFKGNKIYSPNTCCFVPKEINYLLLNCQKVRGEYPIGVSKEGKKFKAWCQIKNDRVYLGSFLTPEEAFGVYKEAKEKEIKQVVKLWKPQIKPNVYNALNNYRIEITD